jgi:hypothetical protein
MQVPYTIVGRCQAHGVIFALVEHATTLFILM